MPPSRPSNQSGIILQSESWMVPIQSEMPTYNIDDHQCVQDEMH